MYDHIHLLLIKVKVCVLQLILGDHVRLWQCPYVCDLRVDALLFLLEYMSLWLLYWWRYSSLGYLKDENDYSYVLLE